MRRCHGAKDMLSLHIVEERKGAGGEVMFFSFYFSASFSGGYFWVGRGKWNLIQTKAFYL